MSYIIIVLLLYGHAYLNDITHDFLQWSDHCSCRGNKDIRHLKIIVPEKFGFSTRIRNGFFFFLQNQTGFQPTAIHLFIYVCKVLVTQLSVRKFRANYRKRDLLHNIILYLYVACERTRMITTFTCVARPQHLIDKF